MGLRPSTARGRPPPGLGGSAPLEQAPQLGRREVAAPGLGLDPHRLDVDDRLVHVILPDRCNYKSAQPPEP
ncbi:MAG: hypothetical protein M3O95_09350, partial [Candidatus Dormibacteraeota bacterium]|nr:hypothetical protein [Candidatus Dormibacteraeota bacterium]